VMRALQKKPEERFPQPEAMAEALARYLARAGEPATSHSLATFLAGLNLPPTLLEQAEPLGTQAPPPAPPLVPSRVISPGRGSALVSQSAASQPEWISPIAAEQPALTGHHHERSAEWVMPENSSALSVSGRLVPPASSGGPANPQSHARQLSPEDFQNVAGAPSMFLEEQPLELMTPAPKTYRCVRCEAPLPSAHAPCDRCATELSTPGVSAVITNPSVLDTPADQLHLEARGPREETLWEPKRRFPWGRWAMRLGIVGALAAGVYFGRPYLERLLPRAESVVRGALEKPLTKPPPILITSEPSGARVVVNGEDKGMTPVVMDNDYPPGQQINFEVTLRGYKPFKGTFVGRAPGQFDVELQKR
jgi:eukaryotic-like serine/threonine-protein kinase